MSNRCKTSEITWVGSDPVKRSILARFSKSPPVFLRMFLHWLTRKLSSTVLGKNSRSFITEYYSWAHLGLERRRHKPFFVYNPISGQSILFDLMGILKIWDSCRYELRLSSPKTTARRARISTSSIKHRATLSTFIACIIYRVIHQVVFPLKGKVQPKHISRDYTRLTWVHWTNITARDVLKCVGRIKKCRKKRTNRNGLWGHWERKLKKKKIKKKKRKKRKERERENEADIYRDRSRKIDGQINSQR